MDSIQWCRRRLLVPGNPLSITLSYAPKERRESILALRTVVSEVAMIPGSVREPEVALRKLDWWRQAVAERLPHPAIQALSDSGAWQWLEPDCFSPLFAAVEGMIDAPRFEQIGELQEHCLDLAGPGAVMEAWIVGGGSEPELAGLAGAGYLLRVIRDLGHDARNHRWLVPLELQAEYQVTRADVAAGHGSRAFDGLVRHLLEVVARSRSQALAGLDEAAAWRHRHQILIAAADRGLAVKLDRRPDRILKARSRVAGPVIGWSVWRRARELRRNWVRAGRP